ncbi:hypothetical protein C8R44DRAFT_786972, partial [Mycena epipterygia]
MTGAAACLFSPALHLSLSAFKIWPAHNSWWSRFIPGHALHHSWKPFSNHSWNKYGAPDKAPNIPTIASRDSPYGSAIYLRCHPSRRSCVVISYQDRVHS